MIGIQTAGDDYYSALTPVINHKYVSRDDYLDLQIGVGFKDWFSCKWTTVPKKNGNAKLLALLPP
jgi:hypothetical protein